MEAAVRQKPGVAEAELTRRFRAVLVEGGFRQVTEAGDMSSPDGTVWVTTGYTLGEFTWTAMQRARGSGPAEGVVRVRVTSVRAERHPLLADQLAADLIDTAATPVRDRIWPPSLWVQAIEG